MSHPVQLSIQAPQETSLSSYWAFLRFVKLSLFKMFFSYFGPNIFLEDLISVTTSTVLSVAQASFLGILIDPSSLDPICTSCECNEFLRPLSSKSIVYFLLGEESGKHFSPATGTHMLNFVSGGLWKSTAGRRDFASWYQGASVRLAGVWGIQWLSVIATYPKHTVP